MIVSTAIESTICYNSLLLRGHHVKGRWRRVHRRHPKCDGHENGPCDYLFTRRVSLSRCIWNVHRCWMLRPDEVKRLCCRTVKLGKRVRDGKCCSSTTKLPGHVTVSRRSSGTVTSGRELSQRDRRRHLKNLVTLLIGLRAWARSNAASKHDEFTVHTVVPSFALTIETVDPTANTTTVGGTATTASTATVSLRRKIKQHRARMISRNRGSRRRRLLWHDHFVSREQFMSSAPRLQHVTQDSSLLPSNASEVQHFTSLPLGQTNDNYLNNNLNPIFLALSGTPFLLMLIASAILCILMCTAKGKANRAFQHPLRSLLTMFSCQQHAEDRVDAMPANDALPIAPKFPAVTGPAQCRVFLPRGVERATYLCVTVQFQEQDAGCDGAGSPLPEVNGQAPSLGKPRLLHQDRWKLRRSNHRTPSVFSDGYCKPMQ